MSSQRDQPVSGRGYAERLKDVSAGLAAAATVAEIADVVIDHGIPALSARTGIVGVVEPPDEIWFVRSVGYGDVFPERLRLDAPWPITACVRSGEIIELRDLPERRRSFAVPERVWRASAKGTLVAVPLLVRGQAIGALGFTREDSAALSPSERGLVEALAGQAAVALERAFLYEADRRARLRAEALHRVASAVATAVTVEDVAGAVASGAGEVLGAGVTVILARPEDDGRADVLATHGLAAAPAASEPTIDLSGDTLSSAALRSNEPLFAESLAELERSWQPSAEVARKLGVAAAGCVPFLVGSRHGALCVVAADARRFPAEERAFLRLLATLCEHGISRASLYEAERSARARADVLHGLSASLSGAVSAAEVGEAFLEHALETMGAGSGALMLADAEGRTLRAAAIGGKGATRKRWLNTVPIDTGYVAAVAYSKSATAFASDRTELEERFPRSAANLGAEAQAAYAEPLALKGRTIGAVALVFESGTELSDDLRRLLTTMCRLCAQAIERAQLYEHERHIASRLQRALLPEAVIEHPRVQITARYHAGGSRSEVGGDWFETMMLSDGRVGFAVGDVVGHGIEAAAAMGRLRSALAALAHDGAEPGELIRRLKRFARSSGAVEFATVCYAVFDPQSGVLRQASAGHPPLLIVEAGGHARWLKGGRTGPLHPTSTDTSDESATVLGAGATALLYSDGLFERRGELPDEGLARLERTAVHLSDLPMERFCDDLLAALRRPTESDDVVLVGFRSDPRAALTFRHVFPARPEELALARNALRTWLRDRGIGKTPADCILLATAEAASNAVEHAYDSVAGSVEIELDEGQRDMTVRVRDDGRWRDGPSSENRGLGREIMKFLATAVETTTSSDGTTVTMRLPIGTDDV